MKDLKVALCCIARNEILYLDEFINYYKDLGFDRIFLYDNSYDGDEPIKELPHDFVTIIDYRNRQNTQLEAYTHCGKTYGKDYDWIAFFDCDEFLHLVRHRNIKEYLSEEMFNDFNIIKINWLCYGDNELLSYDIKPVQERFIIPVLPLDYHKTYKEVSENQHIKSIIRTNKVNNIIWYSNPHSPINIEPCCNASGKSISHITWYSNIDYTYAYIKHYQTKSLEEYMNKIYRGYPDQIITNKNEFLTKQLSNYFKMNKLTEEKIKFLKENYKISLHIE